MAKVGRPKGSVKPKTVPYHRRVRPEYIKILDAVLENLKKNEKKYLQINDYVIK